MVTVYLPDDLTAEFGANNPLSLDVQTLGDLLSELDRRYAGMAGWLSEADGQVRPNLGVFVAGRRLPPGPDSESSIPSGSEVWILRAISGG